MRLRRRWQMVDPVQGRRDREWLEQVELYVAVPERDQVSPSKNLHGAAVCKSVAFFAFLALASAQPARAGTVSIETARDGNAIDIHASAVLNADAGTAWRVLTDYDHYTDFVPGLHLSRVVARRGEVVTVQQSGATAFWLFELPLDITFEIHEVPRRLLVSRAVAGSLRGLDSRYTLWPVPHGTRLDYVGRVVPGFELPERLEQKVVEQSVGRQFQALTDEIERQGARVGVDPMAIPTVRRGSR
jgi:hypothetical protein